MGTSLMQGVNRSIATSVKNKIPSFNDQTSLIVIHSSTLCCLSVQYFEFIAETKWHANICSKV